MSYHILPSRTSSNNDNAHQLPTGTQSNPCSSSTSPSYYCYQQSTTSEIDVSKHLKSLQARLGFARFKMNQGWEKSTLLDVEHLWKQKQQKCIKELPKPRFTQRDVIDKRIYIPSPGARQAKAKKARLVRTYSNPSKWPSESKETMTMNSNIKKHKNPLYFYHYNQATASQHSKDNSEDDMTDNEHHQHRSPSTVTLSSCIEDEDEDEDEGDYDKVTESLGHPHVRNSLDFLSYAIAMTEKAEGTNISSQPLPDISEMEPNLMEDASVEHLDIADKAQDSPPSSPVTSAAKAIMMFVNNQSTANNKSSYSQ